MATKKKHVEETKDEKLDRYQLPSEHFYWLGLIQSKIPARSPEEIEKYYKPFMVNRGMSYYRDTIMAANTMNCNSQLSNKAQFDFLQALISKGKRYEKWIKPDQDIHVENIRELYKVSRSDAKKYLEIINSYVAKDFLLQNIEERISKGGRQ